MFDYVLKDVKVKWDNDTSLDIKSDKTITIVGGTADINTDKTLENIAGWYENEVRLKYNGSPKDTGEKMFLNRKK